MKTTPQKKLTAALAVSSKPPLSHRYTSAPNAKRATLTATLASGAAVTRMRATIGGGAAVPVARPQRGSSLWLRNRDAQSTAVAPATAAAHTPRMCVSTHFGRRPSAMTQIQQLRTAAAVETRGEVPRKQQQQQPRNEKEAFVEEAAAALLPAAAEEAALLLPAAAEEAAALLPAAAVDENAASESEDPDELDELDDMLLESLVATTTPTTITEVERVAWDTWHWPEERLVLAGLDPAVVRAPEVLAAVRARFIHSPNIMLNSNFDCRFSVDQATFKRILRSKYGVQATYVPVSYPGLCCPFYLRRGLPLDPQIQTGVPDAQDVVASDAFKRKYVKATFILFRTGNAFLRGSFSEEVIEFVYNHYKRILVDEYPNIVTRTTRADAKDHRAVVKTRVVYFSRQPPAIKQEVLVEGKIIKQQKQEEACFC